MNKITSTSDAPAGWCYVSEISNELRTSYSDYIVPKYKEKLSFDLGFCLRCVFYEYKWKRRYEKDMNWLSIDISILENTLRPKNGLYYKPLSLQEQRLIMGRALYPYLEETFSKYKNKLDGIKEHGANFLTDTKIWFEENGWLIDLAEGFNIDETFKEINLEYVKIIKICNCQPFDNHNLSEDEKILFEKLLVKINNFLKIEPNHVAGLRLICFIFCYLQKFEEGLIYLKKSERLTSDYKDKSKITQLERLIISI